MSDNFTHQLASVARRGVWPTVTLLTAVAAVASALFGLQPADAAAPPAAPPPPAVSVATVVQTEVTAWDEFSGRLEAVERVDVRSRVAGALLSVHFKEGALVKKGDLLITIDPAPYAAEVDRAEAQVASAQARSSFSRSEQERSRRLWEEKAIAQREYDERVNAGREADASLRAAQASLQTARLSLGYTQVRAPVAGRVGRLEVTVGNLVSAGPGAPVLTTLVSVSPIYASFDADEQIVGRALKDTATASGSRAELDRIPVQMGTAASNGTPFEGRLQLIDNQVDARSGTVRVRAAFDNKDGSLIPGQFARIRMGQAHSSRVVLVSERAIGTDQSKKFVLVVDANDKAEYREVTLGAPANGLRVVSAGLKTGERVIVNGLQHVRPGATVKPEPVPMEAKAPANVSPAAPAKLASNS
ncbi:MAG: efflux RND transporter periplasmic adaptor subunit [Variovorax sp.]|jgi:multidrug efflux system membrane fusion protein|nr:MAG: efflux RND transporter periplasmic adaptor subunit [Variovorax sp.]